MPRFVVPVLYMKDNLTTGILFLDFCTPHGNAGATAVAPLNRSERCARHVRLPGRYVPTLQARAETLRPNDEAHASLVTPLEFQAVWWDAEPRKRLTRS